ncbi:hypothetical protein H257_06834 [Aphanomyces astaci]|uniref:Uncharacterized protein n=1 Tax=Aphanomyces astaci TaxID=112090 RepID=W4GKN5_APHAT|nr:hypothetical protein H257_06834 [Aphanomyces astaci]ETV79574.1 hypothetical protein H257_06834 [Aphanomyces astaci]|eukprot:XP_009830510.1 hypothetical protein H257_06834 [Aphanomyces astaci]
MSRSIAAMLATSMDEEVIEEPSCPVVARPLVSTLTPEPSANVEPTPDTRRYPVRTKVPTMRFTPPPRATTRPVLTREERMMWMVAMHQSILELRDCQASSLDSPANTSTRHHHAPSSAA